ncbi:serine/threonine-protein kinase RsbW [Mariniphaga anaerophila]|uniref:Serine/threonine-protein kinase RsbW n=1 Tax=Mariniphaga anaerophila TaxID=1484053 RepID=A0A1M5EKS9_9BACT|nr:ATP-binding protein [Mariniphaga anaerophila]SHF79849.1 serine/threonine-protein kinase RsbW [Mariniphaga anaerophila]
MKNRPEVLAIKSDKKELEKVEQFLLTIFENEGLPKSCFNRVLLCISEAVVNSIEHGNKNDTSKEVDIHIDFTEDGVIHVNVHDEGEGFDYELVDDPTECNNIKKETGRGIHIMKSLCDKVEYSNQGKSVEIKIDLK